jgi:hypothetical protein
VVRCLLSPEFTPQSLKKKELGIEGKGKGKQMFLKRAIVTIIRKGFCTLMW